MTRNYINFQTISLPLTFIILLLIVVNSQSPINSFRSTLARTLFWHRNVTYGSEYPQRLTTSELIENAGFKSETHEVTTEDQYVLTVHRIPGQLLNDGAGEKEEGNSHVNSTQTKRPIVLYFPGLLSCSDGLVSTSTDRSLPLTLASTFDVWLANPRGCFYSKKHETKSSNRPEFWDFSWHEIGYYDVAAVIDYILKETGQEKLNYIGHSMGTTVIYVLLSTRPEYNEKLNMSISLSPVGYMGHIKSPFLRYLLPILRFVPKIVLNYITTGGIGEYWPRNDFSTYLYKQFCHDDDHRILCLISLFVTVGFDYCQTDRNEVDKFINAFPSGSSIYTSLHYLQSIQTNDFRQFDYGGILLNFIKYGRKKPPKYNLSNIRSPQVFFWADNDGLSDPEDLSRLISELPKSTYRESCRVRFHNFNHFDFITANDVKTLVNDRVVRVLEGKSCRREGEDDTTDDASIICKKSENELNSLSRPVEFLTFIQRFYS